MLKIVIDNICIVVDNIFVEFRGHIIIVQQIIGIPMATKCAPPLKKSLKIPNG